ncbi:MAG TPA: UDP-N-acetylglucosamine 1-carboxyvinyltransferase [Methyloceanibacter sp.]|nr:UDP-N-acetylglucosamine 1-carboxyvinyltransferase [Methyloceanibacter sp.]
MDRIRIIGGERLQGTIQISGAKNAALPLMIASLLTRETLTLKNVPRLADVTLLSRILGNHGVDITVVGKKAGQTTIDGQTFKLKAVEIVDTTAPYEMISRMRASFWVLAPLLARCGEAKVSLPGGCVIGTRPVDLHLTTLESLGASIELEGGYVIAKAPKGLTGARIALSKVSVGATHNALMAAVLARGDTVIENAAREPEVADLASCLRKMRARIGGIGTPTLQVQGAERLHGAEHRVLPDRIETGTYAMAAAMTDGDVMLEGARADLLQEVLQTLRSTGIEIEERPSGLRVAWNGGALNPVSVETSPFPGFPTDLQAQLVALMSRANGLSKVRETVFENRFMHVQELARLGARIDLKGDTAFVTGVNGLHGGQVMATDLRASVSLIIAGLAAQGETLIGRIYHLDRGFERIEEKLGQCGARIERVSA